MSELLVHDSPNGNAQAYVEQDDRVAYLYLAGDERELAMREGSASLARRLAGEGRGWMYRPPRRGWRSLFGR